MALIMRLTDGAITITTGINGETPRAVIDKIISGWEAANCGPPTDPRVPVRARVASWRIIPDDAIPSPTSLERQYREAWCDTTQTPVIDIDIAKARAIHRAKLGSVDAATSRRIDDCTTFDELTKIRPGPSDAIKGAQ